MNPYLLLTHTVLLFACAALEIDGRAAFRVQLDVFADDPTDTASIHSFLSREFRSLQDVRLVERDSDYIVKVLCLGVTNAPTPFRLGFALSIVVLHSIRTNSLVQLGITDQVVLNGLASAVEYEDHYVTFAQPNGLRGLCEAIVVNFDTRILSVRRRLSRILEDSNGNPAVRLGARPFDPTKPFRIISTPDPTNSVTSPR